MRFRLYHVGTSVADHDAMAAWYSEALGFGVEGSSEVERADLRVSLLTHESGLGPELFERAGSEAVEDSPDPLAVALKWGYGHIALEVGDLDESFGHLISVGAKEIWSPRPAPVQGARMSYVADPEGNLIEMVARER